MSKKTEMQYLERKGILDKLKITGTELSHLGIAWLVFIIAIVPQFAVGNYELGSEYSLSVITIVAFAIGFAFIFHEMGHKFAAQFFKAKAEFKLDQRGLLITAVSIALGFYLLAPGAVFWGSNLSKYSNIRGRVSACGPVVNLHLASLSLGLFIFAGSDPGTIGWVLFTFASISFPLNVYLGIFNMIPVWILDGRKIFEWSEMVWFGYILMFLSLILAYKVFDPTYRFYFLIFSI